MIFKKVFIFLLFTFFSRKVVAQNSFEKSFGVPANDERGIDCLQTYDGGYILLGIDNTDDTGYGYLILTKTDSSGNMIWRKDFSDYTLFQTWPSSVKLSSDSGYIITGGSWNFGGSVSDHDIFLLKTDQYGNELWTSTFDSIQSNPMFGVYHETGNDVLVSSDNGYVITGEAGNEELILLKTDTHGSIEWLTKDTGQSKAQGQSVITVENNFYLVAGNTTSGNWNDPKAYLAKFDSNGNKIWSRSFGWSQSNFTYGFTARLTPDGNYALAGIGSYNGSLNGEMLLIKTDTAGNLIWEKTFPIATYSAAYDLEVTSDNGFVLTGNSFDQLGAGYNVYVVKADSAGIIQWGYNYSGAYSYSLEQTNDNGYIVAGQKNNDEYLLKINENGILLSLNDIGFKEYRISVYPNPSSAQVKLILNMSADVKFSLDIFNSFGRKIYAVENIYSNEILVLEKEWFSKGVNFIQLTSTNFSGNIKVVIE